MRSRTNGSTSQRRNDTPEEATPECIRKEIIRYFSDPGIAERCIENIRIEKDRLSWKTFAGKLEEFIDKL